MSKTPKTQQLGRATTLVLLALLAGAAVLGARSAPDVKRYQEMRNM